MTSLRCNFGGMFYHKKSYSAVSTLLGSSTHLICLKASPSAPTEQGEASAKTAVGMRLTPYCDVLVVKIIQGLRDMTLL